jgi:hypothetical protein
MSEASLALRRLGENDSSHRLRSGSLGLRLSRVARRFPQTAYAGLVKSLQMEWQYLQRGTPGATDSFAPVEAALASSFLPALLEESEAGVAKLRALLELSVRQAGTGLPNPRAKAERGLNASRESTATLTASLLQGTPLDATLYARDNSQHWKALARARDTAEAKALKLLRKSASRTDSRCMLRSK